MKIIEKLAAKANDIASAPNVTLAFLGDSVTQGCFDILPKYGGGFETVYDPRSAYHRYVADILAVLYPTVPVNIINAGIGGDNATAAVQRVEQDVIQHKPDLTVVCFGLNDSGQGDEGITAYVRSLEEIFNALRLGGSEVLFMTPNMMATSISSRLPDGDIRQIAESISQRQNAGVLDRYMEAARALCARTGVPVCDCYQKWQILHRGGVDITAMLSNMINHPTRTMNWLFAYSLVETMFTA